MNEWFLPTNSGSNSSDDDNNKNNNSPSVCLIMNPRVIKVVQVDELCQVCVSW
jgi:hypothetical protein